MQGTVQSNGGPRRYVRFGSAKFAAAVLPEDQRSTLLQQVGGTCEISLVIIIIHVEALQSIRGLCLFGAWGVW